MATSSAGEASLVVDALLLLDEQPELRGVLDQLDFAEVRYASVINRDTWENHTDACEERGRCVEDADKLDLADGVTPLENKERGAAIRLSCTMSIQRQSSP